MMPADLFQTVLPAPPSPVTASLRLQTYTYDERREVLGKLAGALDRSGAWVLERTTPSVEMTRLQVEIQLRSALELYSGLVGSGLELTRGTHIALTELCTLARHRRRGRDPFRVVEMVLEVSFLDEMEHSVMTMAGAAAA